MAKANSIEDFKLVASFESVRQTLLQERFADRLSKPLGYWVLPNDRRLPLAFLGRSVGDLLSTPFVELSSTPGIGQKKISSLVKLLNRATKDEPPAVPFGLSELTESTETVAKSPAKERFDPNVVSEALWSEWCEVVRRFDVGQEKLGRLAVSLQTMPTVIWHTPLDQYLGYTVGEIRRLRTHGEKRVRCVLEVFHRVSSCLANEELGVDARRLLTPPSLRAIQEWVAGAIAAGIPPTEADIRKHLVEPMLNQIQTDSGDTVYRLAVERLGINGEPQSVRSQARNLGVTRARVYQLLDDCAKVMAVRWQEGKSQLDRLVSRATLLGRDNADLKLLYGVRELCFPEKNQEEHRGTVTAAKAELSSPNMPTKLKVDTAGHSIAGRHVEQPGAGDEHAEHHGSSLRMEDHVVGHHL